MKKIAKNKISAIAFAALLLLFIVFSVIMLIAEDNKIDSLRNEPPYYKVTDAAVTEIEDSSAPLGMRRQYSFSLDNIDAGDISLAFYTVHQLVTVEIDGETVYTLSSGDGIGTSPSSV